MNEFVMVPVPSHRVMEVYALLASDPSGLAPSEVADFAGVERTVMPEVAGWNFEMIERLLREASNGVRLVFDYLSDRPGQEVSADELASGIDRTRQQLNGILGVFGRNAKNKYQMETWPFLAMRDGSDQTMVYMMSNETADMVKRARRRS